MNAQSAQSVVRNALWNIVPFAWSVALSLATTVYFVQTLGLSHFGLFGLLTVMLTPLGLANLGFSAAAIKYVAQYRAGGDLHEVRRYLETVYWMSIMVGVAGCVLVAVLGAPLMAAFFQIPEQDHELMTRAVPMIALVWLFQQASAALSAVPMAFNSFREVAIGNVTVQTMTAFIQIGLLAAGYGLLGMVIGAAIGSGLGWLIWYLLGRRVTSAIPTWPRLHGDIWRTCARFGGWQTVGQFGGLLATQAERVILGHYLPPVALGVYNAAFRLEQAAYAVGYKMSEVLFPYFSARGSDTPRAKAGMLMRASWLLTTVGVCLLAPFIPLAYPALHIWLGSEVSRDGATVLATLAVGGIVGSATNASYFFLLAHARTRWIAAIALLTGVIVTIVSAALVPRFGLPAAAVSGVVAAIVQAFALASILRRIFHDELKTSDILFSLYVPAILGIGLGLLAAMLPWVPRHWTTLTLSYVGMGAIIAAVVVTVGLLTPGGHERRRDLALLWSQRRLLLRRLPG